MWNARSVREKTYSIHDFILDKDADIFVITETWLAEVDPVVIGEMLPNGYSFMNYPRKNNDEHGGIGIIHKTCIGIQSLPSGIETTSFEHASVLIQNLGLRLVLVYRPPPSDTNELRISQFLDEFDDFVDGLYGASSMKTIFLGDFNVHVDLPTKWDSKRFLETLNSHSLHQYISGPTHQKGHTLDLVMSCLEDNIVTDCRLLPSLGSDHLVIDITVNFEKLQPIKVSESVRNIKGMDHASFSIDLSQIPYIDLSINNIGQSYKSLDIP